MSLRSKVIRQAATMPRGSEVRRRLLDLLASTERIKVRRKDTGKVVEVSRETLKSRGSEYEPMDKPDKGGKGTGKPKTKSQPVKDSDLTDALDHFSDFAEDPLNMSDFTVSDVQAQTVDGIPDDLDSWAEFGEGELADLDEEELFDELEGFRGADWARRAMKWVKNPSSMPPIVIVDSDKHGVAGVGDGRGRTTLAIGMGWDKIPAVTLTDKE